MSACSFTTLVSSGTTTMPGSGEASSFCSSSRRRLIVEGSSELDGDDSVGSASGSHEAFPPPPENIPTDTQ